MKKYVTCSPFVRTFTFFPLLLFYAENHSNETITAEKLLLIGWHKEGRSICYLTDISYFSGNISQSFRSKQRRKWAWVFAYDAIVSYNSSSSQRGSDRSWWEFKTGYVQGFWYDLNV